MMCLQTKSSHLLKELDCETLCNSFIILFKYICYFNMLVVYCINWETSFLVWFYLFYLTYKFTCILCPMHLLVCLGSYQINLYLAFLYVSLYLIMYFQQFKWFLINLLLASCILWYSLLLDVLFEMGFVFTMYLINLADTNIRYSGYLKKNQVMILMFGVFKSLIGTDMTYHFSVDVPLRI